MWLIWFPSPLPYRSNDSRFKSAMLRMRRPIAMRRSRYSWLLTQRTNAWTTRFSLEGWLMEPEDSRWNRHLNDINIFMLQKLTCQRCHFLINYNTALNLKVSPEDYVNIVQSVKDKVALVVLMVDLLDFPCSIWPEMVKLIGKNQPVIVVGNKVDMLPKDSYNYLKHIEKRLKDSVIDAGKPSVSIRHDSQEI